MQWYVRDDIEMIKHMHQIIKKNNLNLKILIRLYPSTNYNKKNLNNMIKFKNLDIDFDSFNFFKKKNFSLEEISSHLSKKNLSINKSLAIFSFGSTFNIEAAILKNQFFTLTIALSKDQVNCLNMIIFKKILKIMFF